MCTMQAISVAFELLEVDYGHSEHTVCLMRYFISVSPTPPLTLIVTNGLNE